MEKLSKKLGRVYTRKNAGTVKTRDGVELVYSYKVAVKASPSALKKLEEGRKNMEDVVAEAVKKVVAAQIPRYTRSSLDSEEAVADIHFDGMALAPVAQNAGGKP